MIDPYRSSPYTYQRGHQSALAQFHLVGRTLNGRIDRERGHTGRRRRQELTFDQTSRPDHAGCRNGCSDKLAPAQLFHNLRLPRVIPFVVQTASGSAYDTRKMLLTLLSLVAGRPAAQPSPGGD